MNLLDYAVPGAYEAIAVADAPIGLTAAKVSPEGIRDTQALLGVETASIRITCDGTDPSATVGYLMAAGESMVLTGKQTLSNLKMHQVTGEASVKVLYFHHL